MKNYNCVVLSAALSFSVLLAGCGGGGGDGGASPAASALSADQKTFEQFTLAPNAAYDVTWSLPYSGSPQSGINFLAESHASVAASPATGTQALSGSSATSLARTLSLPALGHTRYLINGAIVVGSGLLDSASYQGSAIKVSALAEDGSTVVESSLRSNLSIVPLSGTVVAAPAELAEWFNSLYYNTSLLNASAVWTSGAAYLRYTATEVSDVYTVVDYSGTTTGNAPVPVQSGTTIAAMLSSGGISSSADNTVYTSNNGTASTINGVTTYVSAAVIPNQTTPAYRTFYDLNGNVYMGTLVKAGTVIGGSAYPVASASASNGYVLNYSQQIQIRLNAAAVASLSAAATF